MIVGRIEVRRSGKAKGSVARNLSLFKTWIQISGQRPAAVETAQFLLGNKDVNRKGSVAATLRDRL